MQNSPKAPEPRWCSCRVPDVSRRQVLGGLTAASALALAGWPGSARAAAPGRSVTITVMGTSDLHSHAVDWDYYKDAEYTDAAATWSGWRACPAW
ncbi:twin-arginine translocation signal domain-containing protein [Actinomadura luteofluorescens]|uniref:twin-arginine translocation signal domain-containing protein n=1 Tax=Actinomadura luteofluorescens TaxID=46163 RepID=UPI00363B4DD6